MNQTVKFGKGRLNRFSASIARTYALADTWKRQVVRAGVVSVGSSERP